MYSSSVHYQVEDMPLYKSMAEGPHHFQGVTWKLLKKGSDVPSVFPAWIHNCHRWQPLHIVALSNVTAGDGLSLFDLNMI